MTEIFITNIYDSNNANDVLELIKYEFPQHKINYELENNEKDFQCNHSVIRIEGDVFDTYKVQSIVNKSGFECLVLEDKICK